eukprot:GHVS01064845.1.p1 GENE.GHVS01064845.1~~GHVS01064845.1.p1  ORF type:complete len:251 (-),score=28.75 GHVS01064845.1:203-955(-)
MEFFQGYQQRQSAMNLSAVLDFTPLSKPIKEHLTRVYAMLFAGICFTAVGVYTHLMFIRLPWFLSFIAQMGCLIALSAGAMEARRTGKAIAGKRLFYFGGFSFFMGSTIGDLVGMAIAMNPAIPLQALFGSLAIFGCFSVAAMMAKQRSYLFLGGILSSAIGYFALASLMNIFFRSTFLHNFILYASLLTYMGFVIYDTQVAIEDFTRGNRDYVMQAVYLYGDLVAIFIRIMIILMEKSDKDERRNKQKK